MNAAHKAGVGVTIGSDEESVLNAFQSTGILQLKFDDLNESIEKIKKQGKVDDGIELFKKALGNVAPVLEVKSKRIGGATYQVPIEISESRRMALGMRWIITYAKSRKGQTMADRLSAELLAAANNDGSAVKKKEDTHKMAEANKAFAHFR